MEDSNSNKGCTRPLFNVFPPRPLLRNTTTTSSSQEWLATRPLPPAAWCRLPLLLMYNAGGTPAVTPGGLMMNPQAVALQQRLLDDATRKLQEHAYYM